MRVACDSEGGGHKYKIRVPMSYVLCLLKEDEKCYLFFCFCNFLRFVFFASPFSTSAR